MLGNRVDRYAWDGSALIFDLNLIRLRAFQADAGQAPRGNHNGGVIVFGPEKGDNGHDDDHGHHHGAARDDDDDDGGDDDDGHGKKDRRAELYIQVGDTGRRGQMQNLEDGPFGPGIPDDEFGGPEPDDAHLTGVILRLNDDGTTPRSNPFYRHGAAVGGEVGENIQKVFAYGIRNGFGMAFDPVSGDLWEQENGDDSFSELNRVEAGLNSGWVQIMGPVERIAQFKEIETSAQFFGLQQIRWPPPTSRTRRRKRCRGCSCCRARTTAVRRWRGSTRWRPAPSSSWPAAGNFGTVVDLENGPDGNLYAVSIDQGSIYVIHRRRD